MSPSKGGKISQKSCDLNQPLVEGQISTKKENSELCFTTEANNDNSVLHHNEYANLEPKDLNSNLMAVPKKNIVSSLIGLKTLSQSFISQDKPSTLYASILKDDKSDNSDFTNDSVEKKPLKTNLKDKTNLEIGHNSESSKDGDIIFPTRNKQKMQKNFTETKTAVIEGCQKKHSTEYQIKHSNSKPGPLVNMNKVSQFCIFLN